MNNCACENKKLTICGKDVSEYVIVYEATEQPSVVYAAEEMQKFLCKTAGVTVSIETGALCGKPAIKLVYDEAMGENYSIKTTDAGLVISGGKRGILYGVYNFLEDYIGWVFLPYGLDVLLCDADTISVDNVDVDYKQFFEYRSPFFYASVDPSFSAKNMINAKFGKGKGDYGKYGDFYGFTGGHVHTIMALLGDPSHAASVGPNPCIYDEENYKKAEASIKKMLADYPDSQMISVSATDSGVFCQCDDCTGKSIGGNQTDAYIKFVNRLADSIKDEYPNCKLHMLGYGHTFEVPKVVKPRDNVIVQLANMGVCFQHKFEDECIPQSAKFMRHLEKWAEVTEHLYMWDYATDFLVFMATYPNLHVIRENIRCLYEHNVKGIFEQGDMNNYRGKFEDLETYMIAKVLKNPYMSAEEYDAYMNKFMRGYYGAGEKYIRAYYDFIMESSSKVGHFGIYAQPECMFNMQDFLDRGAEVDSWFEAALAAETDEKLHHNIKCVHTSYMYLKLFLTYDYIMENGTEEEKAKTKADCQATFDEIVKEGWRLQDVHPALATFVGKVEPTAHPRDWCTTKNRWDLMAPNGMKPGATGEMYKEDKK